MNRRDTPPGYWFNKHYQRLVARKGKQFWTEQDVKDLEAKVARLIKGEKDGSTSPR